MHLSSLHFGGTQPYLAAPRLLGATLDSQILRTSGIGLLLYDDKRIEETFKPQPTQRSVEVPQASRISNADGALLAELAALKSMYSELERSMNRIKDEFKSFQETTLSSTVVPHTSSDTVPSVNSFRRPEPTFESGVVGHSSLPSFFTNNPWLDVLSKRGSLEEHPIAG